MALHISGTLYSDGTNIEIVQGTQGINIPHAFVIKETLNIGNQIAKKK
jgi:hypothetical protein